MAEIDENIESTYQIFKKRSKDKKDLEIEILKYVNGIQYKEPDIGVREQQISISCEDLIFNIDFVIKSRSFMGGSFCVVVLCRVIALEIVNISFISLF